MEGGAVGEAVEADEETVGRAVEAPPPSAPRPRSSPLNGAPPALSKEQFLHSHHRFVLSGAATPHAGDQSLDAGGLHQPPPVNWHSVELVIADVEEIRHCVSTHPQSAAPPETPPPFPPPHCLTGCCAWCLSPAAPLPCAGVRPQPICLDPPVCARITKCSHVFCYPCILHYLSLGTHAWSRSAPTART